MSSPLKKAIAVVLTAVALLIALFLYVLTSQPDEGQEEVPPSPDPPAALPAPIPAQMPTDLAFDEAGNLFFTEQGGALKLVKRGQKAPEVLTEIEVPELSGYHETGLLGLAIRPAAAGAERLYIFYTYENTRGGISNRIVSLGMDGKSPQPIITDIRAGRVHNGGKLTFGPDGNLYVSTGETGREDLAPDLKSISGKILRLKPDGSVPEDNPSPQSPVWARGLRNVFGLTFDDRGRLWATENGPDTNDEINLIEADQDYGWPHNRGLSYQRPKYSFRSPVAVTGIVAFAGRDELLVGDWNNGALYLLPSEKRFDPRPITRLENPITALAQSPSGDIYAATSEAIVGLGRPEALLNR